MSWYTLPAGVPWLTLLLIIPLVGAGLVLIAPAEARRVIRQLGILTASLTLIVTLLILGGFQHGGPGPRFQLEEVHQWIPSIGIGYHLGIDGLSVFLLGLNALLSVLAMLVVDPRTPRLKQFVLLLLVLETATMGVLLALDLILFYVFWEAMLVPLYFLIGVWGEGRRIFAAFTFLIYTVIGSFAMLVAILAVAALNAAQTGQLTFDWTVLVQHPAGAVAQGWMFLGFALAFAVKMPIFPLHSWLPIAYPATPTPALIVFAGLVSKLGAYGLIRFNLGLFPAGAKAWGPPLAVLATIGILYGAFMALVQTDLKLLVAYASMSHLGFIGLGIFSQNLLGVEGALIQMINHGVIIAALFIIVAMIERRAGTRLRPELSGLAKQAPVFAGLFFVVALAALGLPGLNGFVGEFFIMLGAWSAFLPLAVGAGIAVVLAAWYVLRMFQGAFEGVPVRPPAFADMRGLDVGVLAPLLALIVVFGVIPSFFPAAVEGAVRAVLRL
ncbi:MAG TPA: NADH-quinone oxidoreductase subunit M [Candidatus Limnocylindrales bacterium]|nr:NADH-quinone oxidoreductase subunit M [Candidatus Limnocylindrales bacterium]